MSQIVERADATTVVDEYDAIRNTVQMCLDGEATGDVDKLRAAFHPDARMFGSLAGQRYDVPITELFDLAASAPADTGHYRSRTTRRIPLSTASGLPQRIESRCRSAHHDDW